MVVAGIDPSLTGTGLVVTQGGELLKAMTIDTDKLRGVERLLHIEGRLRFELKPLHSISRKAEWLVCLEGYAYARPNQAHQIGELGGVIRRFLHEERLPWIEISPHSVKKFATGKGNVKKNQVLMYVYKQWGLELDDDNIADAFVLCKMGEAVIKTAAENNVAYSEERLKALEKPLEAYKQLGGA